MIAGGEGIPVTLFPLEFGVSEVLRVFEERPKRLGELVVLLDEGLVVYLLQKGRSRFVFCRCGDEERAGFAVESLLVGEHLVPDIAAAAKGLFKELRLLRGGIKPDLEGSKLDGPPVFRLPLA